MTTPMMKTSWSWSERVSDTVPNRLMCFIPCFNLFGIFYRLVYYEGDDRQMSSSTINTTINHRRHHQIKTITGWRSSEYGGNGIFHQFPWVGFIGWSFGRYTGTYYYTGYNFNLVHDWVERIFIDHNNQPYRHSNNPPQDDQEKRSIKPTLISLL
jgi:hypothetical protein